MRVNTRIFLEKLIFSIQTHSPTQPSPSLIAMKHHIHKYNHTKALPPQKQRHCGGRRYQKSCFRSVMWSKGMWSKSFVIKAHDSDPTLLKKKSDFKRLIARI